MSGSEPAAAVHPEQDHLAHLAAGRFMLLRSPSSGQYIHYPRVAAPGTGARDLEWVEASGLGTVYASTVGRPKPPAAPFNVALIDLAEGPRVMSRVEGIDPADVRAGLAVRARIGEEDGVPILLFDPAEAPR